MANTKFEYGFESVNGIVKKKYFLSDIPNIKENCDVWNVLPIVYVREFTGFKDKKGKEIYEGDLIKTFAGIGEIIWQSHSGEWIVKLLSEGRGYVDIDFKRSQEWNIMGNVHETPELLNL